MRVRQQPFVLELLWWTFMVPSMGQSMCHSKLHRLSYYVSVNICHQGVKGFYLFAQEHLNPWRLSSSFLLDNTANTISPTFFFSFWTVFKHRQCYNRFNLDQSHPPLPSRSSSRPDYLVRYGGF